MRQTLGKLSSIKCINTNAAENGVSKKGLSGSFRFKVTLGYVKSVTSTARMFFNQELHEKDLLASIL